MSNYGVLEYKGYQGTASFSVEDNVWHGKLAGLSEIDLVTYEAGSFVELEEEFRDAVLEYIDDLQWRTNPRLYILQGDYESFC